MTLLAQHVNTRSHIPALLSGPYLSTGALRLLCGRSALISDTHTVRTLTRFIVELFEIWFELPFTNVGSFFTAFTVLFRA